MRPVLVDMQVRMLVLTVATSAALVLGGCGSVGAVGVGGELGPATSALPSAQVAPPRVPGPTVEPTTTEPAFHATVARIDASLAARMKKSWRVGCPVPLSALRYVTVTHLGFDGGSRTGELVVHKDVTTDVVEVFRRMYAAGFPVRSMRLVDDFGADDDRSMAADNTSAFNCRPSTGSPGEWSQHAYGRAIDINPRENPYLTGGDLRRPNDRPYGDRSVRTKGLIRAGDPVVQAFTAIGWVWGGTYKSVKDYQHFSSNGR